jgi:hypothetical protein
MQVVVDQAPLPPAPPAPPGVGLTMAPPGTASPRLAYAAAKEKREVLGEYMSRLLNRRENIMGELRSPNITPAERTALESHLTEVNTSIIAMERQMAEADQQVATAASIPGSTIQEPRPPRDGPPEEAIVVGASFAGIAMVILSIAYARRLWRGGGKVIAQIPAAFENRFSRLEQSVDAVAIEIERISEGQRFLTRVFSAQNPRSVGAGPAQPVESHAGDRMGESVRRS